MSVVTPIPGQISTWADSHTLSGVNSAGGRYVDTLSASPLVPDGVTSNVAFLKSLASVLQGVSPEIPVQVILTLGSPVVVTLNTAAGESGGFLTDNTHYLKPNQSFYFTVSPGGSLPSPLALNTPYYIRAGTQGVDGLTATTFTFSTVNNYDLTIGEGAAVNVTSGSVVGTVSIVLTGRDVNILIPPGSYFGGNQGSGSIVNVTPNGMTRIRYSAYGAIFDGGVNFGVQPFTNDAKTWQFGVYDLVDTTPNELVTNNLNAVIRLQTPANAANYYVGQVISVFGLDIQNSYLTSSNNQPPNNHYQEYKRIIGINVGTGDLTLQGPLKWVYLSTFPQLINAVGHIGGGNALIAQMHPAWDVELEVLGARYISDPAGVVARSVIWKDCVFQGYGYAPGQTAPSLAQRFIYRNCRFGPAPGGQYIEVDKCMEYLEFDSCSFYGGNILFQSPSVQVCRIKNFQGDQITGTPRQIQISDSIANGLLVGPYIGVTDSCYVNNSRILFVDMLDRNDDNETLTPINDMMLVPNWSFSGGIFTRNISGIGNQAATWQIPGAKCYFTDASNQFKRDQNMGSPFTIGNVYMDGSANFSFETSLSAVPTRQTSATVTINIGTSVFSGMTLPNDTPVCLTTTGSLPTGVTYSTIYWVVNTSGATFKLALTKGGAAITLSGAQSGTHTAYANPLCFRPHPCPRFTSIGNSGCGALLDMNGAIDEPLFSRVKRSFVFKQSTLGGNSQAFQAPNAKIWGALNDTDKVMRVNVLKAGVGAGQTLNISCPGFTQPNLGLSTFSQTIDTTTAGIRTVGKTIATSPAGVAGTEAIVAYADWVAGPLVFTWTSPPGALVNSPIVRFEMFTDQGITQSGNMMGAPVIPASGSNLWQYTDSGIISQYGSLP